MNKKLFLLTILFLSICIPAKSYNLDTSVNKEIEKKYESNKLNEDMKVKQTNSKSSKNNIVNKSVPKSTPVFDNTTPGSVKNTNTNNNSIKASVPKTGIKLPSGTKFVVKSNANVSSWSGVNSRLTFTSTAPVYKSDITIPAGTTFKGIISASHTGQMTGNGGLIKIKIISMSFNGNTVSVNGKITKANSKNIFFNNIKGSRQYLQGVDNRITQGVNFYKKARNLSSRMSTNPVGNILSPLPTITGWVGSAVCTLTSPVTGLTQKGKNISLPSGTVFEIKLMKDVYIN